MKVSFTVLGEPASKSNSRRLVRFGSRPAFIKSDKARNYVAAFQRQCPRLSSLMEDDVRVTITIYYASRRPDLDESVLLDAMQGYVIKNDRQIKERHVYWGLDKANPRAVIQVEPL